RKMANQFSMICRTRYAQRCPHRLAYLPSHRDDSPVPGQRSGPVLQVMLSLPLSSGRSPSSAESADQPDPFGQRSSLPSSVFLFHPVSHRLENAALHRSELKRARQETPNPPFAKDGGLRGPSSF